MVHAPVLPGQATTSDECARELFGRPLRLGPITCARHAGVILKRFPGFAICGFALLACMTDGVTGTFPAGCHSRLHALGLRPQRIPPAFQGVVPKLVATAPQIGTSVATAGGSEDQ